MFFDGMRLQTNGLGNCGGSDDAVDYVAAGEDLVSDGEEQVVSSNVSQTEVYEMEIETARIPRTLLWALSVSIGLHILALGTLGLIKIAQKMEVFSAISRITDNEDDPLRNKFDTTVDDHIGTDGEVNTYSASRDASTVLSKDPQREIESSVETSLGLGVSAPVTDELPQPSKSNVLATVATTGTTEHAGGVEGAIDRLAFEIASSLREKKTLVVWLFDVSPSLSTRREKIADRVENVYKQLNQLNVGADKALKSAVAVFGEKCTIVTDKPVDDAADLVKAVRKIKSESSGDENTFGAVLRVAKHFLPFRTEMRRDVMIIIVTDEEGSDPDNLEQAIVTCKKYGMRCYCVGDSAPFGRKNVEAPFEMENGETVIGVMQKGPESKYAELVRLGFWGTNSYDLDDMSSGFGPYGLTRLCAETNGLYFITDNGRGQHKFDPAVMRNYTPDYRAIPVLDRDIQQNKAKYALIEACLAVERETQNRKVLSISMPRLDFRSDNDTVLRQDITEAQKPIADLNLSLETLLRRLEQGEKDRTKIKESRWRASYDLAMGRTLALNVRGAGYNKMLAEMKANPKKFEKAGNNQWLLVPAKEINSGVAEKKLASKAAEYLSHVIDDHPGTPWALLAEREKGVPMGWEWKESHYNPNPVMAAGNQKMGPKFIEVEDPKTKKKVKKQVNSEPQRRDI